MSHSSNFCLRHILAVSAHTQLGICIVLFLHKPRPYCQPLPVARPARSPMVRSLLRHHEVHLSLLSLRFSDLVQPFHHACGRSHEAHPASTSEFPTRACRLASLDALVLGHVDPRSFASRRSARWALHGVWLAYWFFLTTHCGSCSSCLFFALVSFGASQVIAATGSGQLSSSPRTLHPRFAPISG